MVKEDPEQIEPLFTDITGRGLTVTNLLAVPSQALTLNPITEYVVDEPGATEIEELVAPVFQEYEDAPLAINTTLSPLQIADNPLIITLGNPITETVETAMLEHPFDPAPVTV
jgi:hypothetical protein